MEIVNFYNYRFTYFSKYLQHEIKTTWTLQGTVKLQNSGISTAIKTGKSMNYKVENGWKKQEPNTRPVLETKGDC